MLNFLPAPLMGAFTALLFASSTLFAFIILIPFILLKVLIPNPWVRHYLTRGIMVVATVWIDGNSLILKITRQVQWDIQGLEDSFRLDHSYLVVSNHRSWADIFVLQHIFNHRIPFLKFFLKKELIWVPVLGVIWWGLDYPFMKRYSRQFIEQHPELRGKDMETTRTYCERYKKSPVTVLNFLEGTRFNKQKYKKQNPPFQHLLMPKAGGIAIVLSSMGEYLTKIIDVTLVYPKNEPPMTFWGFLKGNIPLIVVRIRTKDVPKQFLGKHYEDDEAFRSEFQQWVNRLWKEKDQTIHGVLEDYR